MHLTLENAGRLVTADQAGSLLFNVIYKFCWWMGMWEHSHCQHKALKPADFKFSGAVLRCPDRPDTNRRWKCGQVLQWPGLGHWPIYPASGAMPTPQWHPPTHVHIYISTYLSPLLVTLLTCLFGITWFHCLCHSLHNEIFAVPCNSHQQHVALCKVKGKEAVADSPWETDCELSPLNLWQVK